MQTYILNAKMLQKIIGLVLAINGRVVFWNVRMFTKQKDKYLKSSVPVHLSGDISPRFTKANDITAIWNLLGIPRVLIYFT